MRALITLCYAWPIRFIDEHIRYHEYFGVSRELVVQEESSHLPVSMDGEGLVRSSALAELGSYPSHRGERPR